ncbi:sulfatase [Saccharibacillus sp. CPCC 101409]|uniref:sulfatase family protein n=1 Tax=Saccharibacillus sp. CPCC 101409 TaxID=3058041 RepID=UPI0026728EB7|nr:sulfatase [Saccharibacillus sp. CPCC 101409]MDO3409920.1 sulfatase [Saccharibacillus sp. CPCC 101409]
MRVLLLDLDSTSPDHLGCYGYERDTSPNLDRLAEQGVRFTNYFTSDAPCMPSRTALMSGQFGIHNGVVNHGGRAGDPRQEGEDREFVARLTDECFPALFRAEGMHTALVSPFGERHSAWHFYAGFNEIHNTGARGGESAEQVTPVVLDWLERNARRDDWMLYVNYWDPHTPYRAPEEFGNPFEDEPLPGWMTDETIARHRAKTGPHSMREINMYDSREQPEYPRQPGEIRDRDDLKRMIDGYDCGIRYMDGHIGQIFETLERLGAMDDTIVVVTADHGENMGQLGIYGEHGTADRGTCRIPMIIRWPGMRQGHVDHGLHYHLDLPPTFADLLGRPAPKSWDGQSYAPALKSGEDSGRSYLVISQCAHVCQRSVRFGRWLYMRTYHDGYHLFDRDMLFDLEADPYEQRNIASSHPELCREGMYLLAEWHDDMMKSMPYPCDTDPLWTVMSEGGPYHARGHLPRYIERLKATGRAEAAEELARRHPREFE